MPSDADLVAACRAGDDEAWNACSSSASRGTSSASRRRPSAWQPHEAEEVFQRCSCAPTSGSTSCARTMRSDPGSRSSRATVHRLAARGHRRGRSRRSTRWSSLPDDGHEPLDDALAVHGRALPTRPECQEILDRFFARDESYRTIGDALAFRRGRSRAASRAASAISAASWKRRRRDGRNRGRRSPVTS